MKKSYFIDTNIFLRVLLQDSEKQFNDCKEVLELVKTNKIQAATSSLVISEVTWVLQSYYKVAKADVVKAIGSILNLSGLKFVNDFDNLLALEFFRKFSVKFIDCQIASIPQISNKTWSVISYDRDFDKMGIKRIAPGKLLKTR